MLDGQLSAGTPQSGDSDTERESLAGSQSAGDSSDSESSDFDARVSECNSTPETTSHVGSQYGSSEALSDEQSASSTTSLQRSSPSLFSAGSEPSQQRTFITQSSLKSEATRAPAEESSLIMAVKRGDVQQVRRLLKSGRRLNDVDTNKRTALHVACGLGKLDIVQLLIEEGFSVDSISQNGQTPLHEACTGGHLDILSELISEVMDLDATDHNGMSAAHYCALHGEVSCLSLLCDQGCDICLEDRQGRTGVHLAAMKDHEPIIQCFMERGMELDTTGNSFISW